ncbi:inositol monophosphatase family protein [Streptomyces sp. NRRL S-1824]|uniref:inositol monophosphatase family protein n=1 Tax=Streptomyces sp. NRRL S-1824 TaxID=1463889 RepID=UPI00099C4FF6|nr:inositol monophosphatase family protein [Streptomyces sp. NRRL S-1824]
MIDARSVCLILLEAADRFLYHEPDRVAIPKGTRDVVTETDRSLGLFLAERLGDIHRDAQVIGEDLPHADVNVDAEWRWRIDPIDGTVNFSRNLPCYSICVALEQAKNTRLAVVFDVERRHFLTALAGGGAIAYEVRGDQLTNGKIVSVTPRPVDQSLFSVMLTPKMSSIGRASTLRLMDHLLGSTQGVRVLVSQALEASWLAQGRLDAVVTLESRGGWTRSAATLLTVEAGGHVVEFHDSDSARRGFLLSADASLGDWLGDWFKQNELSITTQQRDHE